MFEQLAHQVMDRIPQADRGPIKRNHRGSLSDPGRWEKNWNRSFELAVFDINRQTGIDELLAKDPMPRIRAWPGDAQSRYVCDRVTNENPTSRRVVVHRRVGDRPVEPAKLLAWQWPNGVHSLSHVALPFPSEDPRYGASDAVSSPGIALSKIMLSGERGVINIPASEMLRLECNPFYPYLEQRVLTFFQMAE